MKKLSWRSVLFADHPNAVVRKDSFKIDPWVSFVKRVLMPILVGDLQRFMRKSEELIFREGELEAIEKYLPPLCGKALSRAFVRAVQTADLEDIKKVAPKLRRVLIAHALRTRPLASIKTVVYTLWQKIAQPFNTCGPVISVVGPDGVGKSTLTNILLNGDSSIFTKIVIRHWRPSVLPRLGALIGKSDIVPGPDGLIQPRRKPGRFHWFRLGYYFVDFLLGHFTKDRVDSSRQRVVFYDRCALDMVVDPLRYGLSSTRGTRLFWKLIPKPDMVILLYDEPERIHARKPELPVEEIRSQLESWLRLAEEGEIDAIIRVDAPPEELARRVKDLVIEAFIEKNGGPVSSRTEPIQWLRSILNEETSEPVSEAQKSKSVKEQAPYEFGYLNLKDGRGYLIPLRPRKAAVESFRIYNAQSMRARIAKSVLKTGLKAGLAQPFLPKVYMTEGETNLFEHIKDVLGHRHTTFAISLGTPGAHRKPVIQILNEDGKILGYVKVGWNETTNALVQNEAKVLQQLKDMFHSFLVPEVFYAGEWHRRFLCVQLAPKGEVALASQTLIPQYLKVINELAHLYKISQPLEESAFWKRIKERVNNVQNAYYRHVLLRGLQVVREAVSSQPLPFHCCHGDLTPWNAYVVEGKLCLYDWEYANPQAPAGYDLFHFLVQTLWLIQRKKPWDVLRAIMSKMEEKAVQAYWDEIGIEQEALSPLFLLYLLDRLSLYGSEEPESFEKARFFALLVNLCVHKAAV